MAPKSSTVGQGGLLAMPRDDGFTDGFNVIQGVRAMDPGQGSWTTPDAYAGDVHDPMSQKSYMWNNNNGISYSDPSGYDALYRDYYHEGDTPIAEQRDKGSNSNAPKGSAPTAASIANNGSLSLVQAEIAAGKTYTDYADAHICKYCEASATIACDKAGNNCVVGDLTFSTTENAVQIDFPERTDGRIYFGWWHSHPPNTSAADSLADHQREMAGIAGAAGFALAPVIATSLGKEIVSQPYNTAAALSTNDMDWPEQVSYFTLCSNCIRNP